MKHRLLLLVFWCLCSSAVFAEAPQTHIEAATVKWVDAFNSGDGSAVASLYTEDAALFPPGSDRVDGRAAIAEFWQGAIDSGMRAEDLHGVEVDARGDLASEVGVFTLSVPGESGVNKVQGQYIVVWKRIGHEWQLHRDIWNTK